MDEIFVLFLPSSLGEVVRASTAQRVPETFECSLRFLLLEIFSFSHAYLLIHLVPSSITGIDLAVISIAAQYLTGAIQGSTQMYELTWRMLSSFSTNMSCKISETRTLYPNICLRLEEQRLYSWRSVFGLLRYLQRDEAGSDHSLLGFSRRDFHDTLYEIHVLLQEFIRYKITMSKLLHEKWILQAGRHVPLYL